MKPKNKILVYIGRNPSADLESIKEETSLSESSARSHLSDLRTNSFIVMSPSTGTAELIKKEIGEDEEIYWAITGKGRSRLNELHREKIEEVLNISKALSMPWFRPPSQGSEPENDKEHTEER